MLIWGLGAFGSPYEWAYRPLIFASGALGAVAWWMRRHTPHPRKALIGAVLLVPCVIGLQLVPVNAKLASLLTPNAEKILKATSLDYSLNRDLHPISIAPRRTALGLTFVAAFAVLFIGTAKILDRQTASKLTNELAALGAVLAIVGIVQRESSPSKIYGVFELSQGGAPFGPFVNKNHFAGCMLMLLPLSIGAVLSSLAKTVRARHASLRHVTLAFSTVEGNRTLLLAFATLLMFLALILTMSRSGMIAIFLALIVMLIAASRQSIGTVERTVTIGFLLLPLVIVIAWAGVDSLIARFNEIEVAGENQRPAIWRDALAIGKDFWLTGTGFNTFGASTLLYQTSVPNFHLREAHNDYLQLAVEGGLLVCLPIIVAIVMFATDASRAMRRDIGSVRWLRLGALAGIFAVAIQSLVEFSLQMPGNAALFSVLSGLALHDSRSA
jgi:hypothetical protein